MQCIEDVCFVHFILSEIHMPVVINPDSFRPFNPQLEDLATYLARIKGSRVDKTVEQPFRKTSNAGVLAVLKALEDIYSRD